MKKKRQIQKKKHKTYRPTFADRLSKHKKNEGKREDKLLQAPHKIGDDIKITSGKLPEQYHPRGAEAYTFPSWGYVVIVLLLLFVLLFLLF